MATEADNGGALLEVDGVVKRFGGIRAVDGAGFDVGEGSITALIGPNGAGKTTLFNAVTGFQRVDGGSARLGGEEILHLPAYAIARRGMVRTFQVTKALAAMPVIDNMTLAASGACAATSARFAPGRGSCSSSSTSATAPAPTPAPSPAASASCWSWRGR